MYKRILVPVNLDDKRPRRRSMEAAVEMSRLFGAELYVMTVILDVSLSIVNQYFSKSDAQRIEKSMSEDLKAYIKKSVPKDVKARAVVKIGNVYDAIIGTAKDIDADLIIMSAHRPELKDYLLGPNAARVVRHSDRSVLVVRD